MLEYYLTDHIVYCHKQLLLRRLILLAQRTERYADLITEAGFAVLK